MPYLIDGHNLIGSIPDIHLDEPEDEMRLIQRLSEFLKNSRKTGTVYFDQRGHGAQRKFKFGRLQVEFATSPHTADLAIQNRLRQLKGNARNYTVVSSDHEVKRSARDVGAQVIDSNIFAQQLDKKSEMNTGNEKPENILTPEDIHFWQKFFENPPEN